MQINLKKYREMASMSQSELASIVMKYDKRIDTPMISKFESGVCLPTIKVAEIISNALEIPIEDIWENEDTNTNEELKPRCRENLTAIEALIPHGHDNGIRATDLAKIMGCTERRARVLVEEAVKAGALIGNLQNGKGYFIADNDMDLIHIRNQERRRAMAVMKKVKTYNNALRERGYWI